MKKNLFISTLFLIVVLVAVSVVSCETDPLEYCEQDNICDVDIEVCCTDDGNAQTCVWKYNGQEYTSEEDLIDDLNCAPATVPLKSSVSSGLTREEIRLKLTELMERAHAGLYGLK